MTQLGWWPGSKSASKHSFASPSIMTFIHPSATASLAAQSTAATSAWAGGHLQYGLIHVLMGVPEWSLATTASAVKVLLTAVSTLSFMFYTMFRHYASRVLALCSTVAAIVLWFFFFSFSNWFVFCFFSFKYWCKLIFILVYRYNKFHNIFTIIVFTSRNKIIKYETVANHNWK